MVDLNQLGEGGLAARGDQSWKLCDALHELAVDEAAQVKDAPAPGSLDVGGKAVVGLLQDGKGALDSLRLIDREANPGERRRASRAGGGCIAEDLSRFLDALARQGVLEQADGFEDRLDNLAREFIGNVFLKDVFSLLRRIPVQLGAEGFVDVLENAFRVGKAASLERVRVIHQVLDEGGQGISAEAAPGRGAVHADLGEA